MCIRDSINGFLDRCKINIIGQKITSGVCHGTKFLQEMHFEKQMCIRDREETMAHPKEFAEGLSIGIIMDGNGRWAKNRGLPRTAGHKRGAEVDVYKRQHRTPWCPEHRQWHLPRSFWG